MFREDTHSFDLWRRSVLFSHLLLQSCWNGGAESRPQRAVRLSQGRCKESLGEGLRTSAETVMVLGSYGGIIIQFESPRLEAEPK